MSVENAVGVAGLAHRVAAQLHAVGFQIGDVGTVPASGQTEIRYSPDRADSARTVAAAVPGAVLVPDTSGSGAVLQLVLGSPDVAVRAVRTAPSAATAPAPAASAAHAVSAAAATCAP